MYAIKNSREWYVIWLPRVIPPKALILQDECFGKNYSSFLDFTCNNEQTSGIFVPWVGKLVQWIFKSVCASTQSDQSLSFLPEITSNPWLPKELPSKTLIRLCGCTGWSKSLMSATANLYPLLEFDSNYYEQTVKNCVFRWNTTMFFLLFFTQMSS